MIAGNLSTSCWDESGTDPGTSGEVKSDCPIILVGGYIAHVKEWVDLDEKWAEVQKWLQQRLDTARRVQGIEQQPTLFGHESKDK